MAEVGIKELLEAGVHFGHQTRRWNPKMRRFIYGERGGIHILDLQKTVKLLSRAQDFAAEVASRGGTILFVGTKKQARDAVKETAERADMPYVHHRWLGGLLTNYQTMSMRIKRLEDLTEWSESGTLELLPTRERIAATAEREKLEANLGGVRRMQRVPDAVFVIDLKAETIAVREAERLRIPIIGLVDTNVDPDPVTYPIPGNDDAIRSCQFVIEAIGDVVAERAARFRAEEEQARREAEERTRRAAEEERARREAEEAALREAEEATAEAARREPAQPAAAQTPAATEASESESSPEPSGSAADAGASRVFEPDEPAAARRVFEPEEPSGQEGGS